MLIWGIMLNSGLNFRTIFFMKIQSTGPIVGLETFNMAHFFLVIMISDNVRRSCL